MGQGSSRRERELTTSGGGIRRFAQVPRQSLARGAGGLRDLWVEQDRALRLQWQLQLVELRGPQGRIQLPDDTVHLIVGISGAQVEVQAADARPTPLRRDQALVAHGSSVEFSRPGIRGIGLSRLIVLSSAASLPPARFAVTASHGALPLSRDILALVVLKGSVTIGESTVSRDSAFILGSEDPGAALAASAQVLTISRP